MPECFDPSPPPAVALTRLAAAHLRKALYLPVLGNNDTGSSPSDGSSSSGRSSSNRSSSSSWSERSQFTHLERMCSDDDDDDNEDDIVNGVRVSSSTNSSGCLHFRNFAWLLVGGGLRRLQRGDLFSPFPNFNRFEFTCVMNVARIFS